MDELENKLGAVLSNPEMMKQIMSLAQNLQAAAPESRQEPEPPAAQNVSAPLDPSVLKKLSGLMGKSGVDPNQRSLLQALRPYLSNQRISKLERAMRAAKMAGMATNLLGSSQLFSGR